MLTILNCILVIILHHPVMTYLSIDYMTGALPGSRAGARTPAPPGRGGGPHDPQGPHVTAGQFFTVHTPLRHIRVQFYSVHVATKLA